MAGVGAGVVQMMNMDRLSPRYRDQGNPAMTVLFIMAVVMVAFLGIPTGMYLMNQRKNPRKPKVTPLPNTLPCCAHAPTPVKGRAARARRAFPKTDVMILRLLLPHNASTAPRSSPPPLTALSILPTP